MGNKLKSQLAEIVTLAGFLAASFGLGVRLYFMNVIASDKSHKPQITPPAYMSSSNLLILWYIWAISSILVVMGVIFYVGYKE